MERGPSFHVEQDGFGEVAHARSLGVGLDDLGVPRGTVATWCVAKFNMGYVSRGGVGIGTAADEKVFHVKHPGRSKRGNRRSLQK